MQTSRPEDYIPESLKRVIQSIREGTFGEKQTLMDLVSTITNNNDWYLVTGDFDAYIQCQQKVFLFL